MKFNVTAVPLNADSLRLGRHASRDISRSLLRATWFLTGLFAILGPGVCRAAVPAAKFATAKLFFIGEDFREDLTVTWLAYGDFNNDGKLDLVSADGGGPAFSIMLGNGDGTFQPSKVIYLPTGSAPPEYVAVGDVNHDGNQDVIIRTAATPSVLYVYLGDSKGGFSLAGSYTTGNSVSGNVHGFALADLRGNGKLDIVATNRDDDSISALLGNGDGTFKSQVTYKTGTNSGPVDLAIGDFNRDGHLDVATVDSYTPGVSILLGNGDGSFQVPTFYAGGFSGASGIVAGDLKGDGSLDVVIASYDGATVFLNSGSGTFAPGVSYYVPWANSIAIGDLNGDKKLDLVVTDESDSAVYVLLGRGNGTFAPAVGYASDWYSQAVVLADFNGDGKLDVAIGNTHGAQGVIALGNGDGTLRAGNDFNFTANTEFAITSADFNNDGNLDVALAAAAGIDIELGSSHGVLGARTNISLDPGVASIYLAAADLNHDGNVDLVASTSGFAGTNQVAVLLGEGNGKFKAPVFYPTGNTSGAGPVVVVDVNGDGKPDLLISSPDGSLNVLLGNGNGTFKPAIRTAGADSGASYIATGDFNHDGKLDVALCNYSGSTVEVLLGNGDGTFQAPISTPSLSYPQAIVAGDFNKDGKLDLAVASGANDGEVGIFLGNGDGTFSGPNIVTYIPSGFGFGTSPTEITTADVNSDGVPDLLVTLSATHVILGCGYFPDCEESNIGLVVLLGNGKGGFSVDSAGPFLVAAGTAGPGVTVGDFDRDGMPDAAVLSNWFGYTEVTMLLNRTLPVSVSPRSINYGAHPVDTSTTQTVLVTNDLSASLAISNIALRGTDAGDFSFNSGCGSTLESGSHCTISVIFKPTIGGTRTASLVITDNAPAGGQTVALSGVGLAIKMSPTNLKFGTVKVGQSSSLPVAVTNISGSVVDITAPGITIAGAAAGDYSQTNDCGSSIEGGKSCTITVKFTPTKIGARNATLEINDNGGGSPQKVPLSGTGE